MQSIKIFTVFLFLLFNSSLQSQTNWSLRTGLGIASESNLGDTGLRISSKVSRHFGKWSAFAQVGAFQMLRSNENWTGDDVFRNKRSLSTANIDLGAGFALIRKNRVRLNANAAASYRIGRQLWPELAVTMDGFQREYYTHEKLSELGYALGLDLSVKASERIWFSLDAHSHNYNSFGEYLGLGLGATILF